jgi:hypothetical protein
MRHLLFRKTFWEFFQVLLVLLEEMVEQQNNLNYQTNYISCATSIAFCFLKSLEYLNPKELEKKRNMIDSNIDNLISDKELSQLLKFLIDPTATIDVNGIGVQFSGNDKEPDKIIVTLSEKIPIIVEHANKYLSNSPQNDIFCWLIYRRIFSEIFADKSADNKDLLDLFQKLSKRLKLPWYVQATEKGKRVEFYRLVWLEQIIEELHKKAGLTVGFHKKSSSNILTTRSSMKSDNLYERHFDKQQQWCCKLILEDILPEYKRCKIRLLRKQTTQLNNPSRFHVSRLLCYINKEGKLKLKSKLDEYEKQELWYGLQGKNKRIVLPRLHPWLIPDLFKLLLLSNNQVFKILEILKLNGFLFEGPSKNPDVKSFKDELINQMNSQLTIHRIILQLQDILREQINPSVSQRDKNVFPMVNFQTEIYLREHVKDISKDYYCKILARKCFYEFLQQGIDECILGLGLRQKVFDMFEKDIGNITKQLQMFFGFHGDLNEYDVKQVIFKFIFRCINYLRIQKKMNFDPINLLCSAMLICERISLSKKAEEHIQRYFLTQLLDATKFKLTLPKLFYVFETIRQLSKSNKDFEKELSMFCNNAQNFTLNEITEVNNLSDMDLFCISSIIQMMDGKQYLNDRLAMAKKIIIHLLSSKTKKNYPNIFSIISDLKCLQENWDKYDPLQQGCITRIIPTLLSAPSLECNQQDISKSESMQNEDQIKNISRPRRFFKRMLECPNVKPEDDIKSYVNCLNTFHDWIAISQKNSISPDVQVYMKSIDFSMVARGERSLSSNTQKPDSGHEVNFCGVDFGHDEHGGLIYNLTESIKFAKQWKKWKELEELKELITKMKKNRGKSFDSKTIGNIAAKFAPLLRLALNNSNVSVNAKILFILLLNQLNSIFLITDFNTFNYELFKCIRGVSEQPARGAIHTYQIISGYINYFKLKVDLELWQLLGNKLQQQASYALMRLLRTHEIEYYYKEYYNKVIKLKKKTPVKKWSIPKSPKSSKSSTSTPSVISKFLGGLSFGRLGISSRRNSKRNTPVGSQKSQNSSNSSFFSRKRIKLSLNMLIIPLRIATLSNGRRFLLICRKTSGEGRGVCGFNALGVDSDYFYAMLLEHLLNFRSKSDDEIQDDSAIGNILQAVRNETYQSNEPEICNEIEACITYIEKLRAVDSRGNVEHWIDWKTILAYKIIAKENIYIWGRSEGRVVLLDYHRADENPEISHVFYANGHFSSVDVYPLSGDVVKNESPKSPSPKFEK